MLVELGPSTQSLKWNTLYQFCFQSVVIGVSAGISFHFLTTTTTTTTKRSTEDDIHVGDRSERMSKYVTPYNAISNVMKNIRTNLSCYVPQWTCLSPSLLLLFVARERVDMQKIILWTAIGTQLLMISSRNNNDTETNGGSNDDPDHQQQLFYHKLSVLSHSDSKDHDNTDELVPKVRYYNEEFVGKSLFVSKSKDEQRDVKHSEDPKPKRFLEVLVHNVSHSDLVLGFNVTNATTNDIPDTQIREGYTSHCDWENICLARPRFSSFDKYCRLILEQVGQIDSFTDTVVCLPRYQRTLDNPRYAIQEHPLAELPSSPAGIQLCNNRVCMLNRKSLQHEFKVRTKDAFKLDQYISQHAICESIRSSSNDDNVTLDGFAIKLSHAIFPFLATSLPVWEQSISAKIYRPESSVKRVLILVTGVGTPRNKEHSLVGNSTEHLGKLLKRFVQRIDPNLTVVQIHSTTNVFRHDENLIFAERELMPTINAYRDALATGAPYPDELPKKSSNMSSSNESTRMNMENCHLQNFGDWRQFMSVTLSFACGSPARTTAIQASLRHFKPAYFHFWQHKTFWHEQKIVDDDIEIHSFEAMMETSPAQDIERVRDVYIQSVVKEMKAFQGDMAQILSGSPEQHDLYRFWLRKTKKLVLSVLLVHSNTMKQPQVFRGTNMEVSMPTGSLCAERNVIGTALSQLPNLKRQDLKVIAVLAVPTVDYGSSAEESCYEIPRTTSYASLADAAFASNSQLVRKFSVGSDTDILSRGRDNSESIGSEHEALTTAPILANLMSQSSGCLSSNAHGAASGASTPVRRIPLFSGSVTHHRNPKRTVLVQSEKDTNPLRPCGACNEWLKKIAESNPYFRIVTFTDAQCKGIYISSCQD